MLDYSRKLAKYADEEDLMPGLGHVSLAGGVLAQEGKAREVRGKRGIWLLNIRAVTRESFPPYGELMTFIR